MRYAVNNLQKTLFVILLFFSGCSGLIADITEAARTAFYLTFDVLIIALALMSISFVRAQLAVILLFLVTCIIFNIVNSGNNILYSLNGLREILNIFALAIFFNHVFSDGNEELAADYTEIMKKFAKAFLIAQIPAAGYQFIIYGPSDQVGGTYGNLGTGNLTLSVICLVFFMSHFTKTFIERAILYACLIPLFLNETKVSFILIPMLILFIHFQPKIKNILGAGVAAVIALFIFNTFFTTNIGGGELNGNIAGIFSWDFIDGYLFGQDLDLYTDVPRFTKIVIAWQLLAENTITFLFGFEYGIFRSTDIADMSQFSQNMQWLMVGTRPYLFFLLIQGGILLVLGFMWLLLYINRFFASRNNKYKTFLFLLFLVILVYNDALRSHNVTVVYFFSIFFANSNFYNRYIVES